MVNNKAVVCSSLLALAGARSVNNRASPPVSRRWNPGLDKIRGVNLGSQFIIEPWMANDAWSEMGCGDLNDEWQCVQSLGQEQADAVFASHWDSWTTQDDIGKIKSYGLNTIRVPVGFWIKEDLVHEGEYYPRGGLQYLDRLVGWAAGADIKVIMDLHGGPGAQYPNQQYTGHGVDYPGFYTADNYERAEQFLEWITERIHTNGNYSSVFMLEVLNEPVHAGDYPNEAADMIQNYYPGAWSRIRAKESELGVAEDDQLHIQMMGQAWGSGDPTSNLPDTHFAAFDDHRYYKWDNSVDRSKDGYISAVCSDNRGGDDTIIGEWSISVADDVENNDEFRIDGNPAEQVDWYQKYWAAQVQTFEKSGGWVFWTWKCNWIGGKDEWRWCYESAVAAGVIPEDATNASSISPC